MLGRPLSRTLQHIRSLLGASAADVSDRQFLERFARDRDEAAFEALVRRHGNLVLGVCRRVLTNEADAEDAFQATFLLLARRASTLVWNESIGGWLYKVAYHIASRSRRAAARRRQHEERVPPMPPNSADASAVAADLRPILDEELHRLPEKYRLPLLLCYLQGKSREEAARELGWTLGAVKGRLERGRELLRGRLDRRGIAGAGVALPALFEQEAAAALSLELISKTVRIAAAGTGSAAVTALMKGALQAMFFAKLRKAALLFAITVAVLGSSSGLYLLSQGEPTAQAVPLPPVPGTEPALASEPVEKDGLRVTVTTGKAKFIEGEEIAFKVTLKNVSPKSFQLFDATYYWSWQIRFGDWQVAPLFDAKRVFESVKLEAGKEVQVDVKLDDLHKHEFRYVGQDLRKAMPQQFLRAGKYPLVVEMNLKNHPDAARMFIVDPFWQGEITSKATEIEIAPADIAYGEAVDGVRIGLSPPKIEVGAKARDVTVALWYHNASKEERKVQTFQGGNICPVMFAVEEGKKQSFVDFVMERSATTPPRFVTLAPGERFRESIKVPFDGPVGFGFANLRRPAAGQPLKLQAGLCTKIDTGGKASWEAVDTRHSGSITIALVGGTGE